jgi:hypothetical protein
VEAAVFCAGAAPLLFLRKHRALALCLFTVADLWRFGHDLQPTVSQGFYREPVPLAKRLQNRPDRFILDPLLVQGGERPLDGATPEAGYQSIRQALYLNLQAPFRIHQAWSYEVFPNRLFTEVRHALDLQAPFGPLLDYLGARYILSTRPLPPPAAYVAQRPNALLYENAGALPRVLWVPRAVVTADGAARTARMTSAWKPREEVILEEGTAGEPGGGLASFTWDDVRPGRLTAEGRSEGGWISWSQVLTEGWEAYVNGRRTALRRANHAFQAVALPRGDWRVTILYRPRLVFNGMAAAAALWAAAAAAGLLVLRRL